MEKEQGLINRLRVEGFGVTVFEGEGENGDKRYKLGIVVKRSREKELLAILDEEAPKAFIVSSQKTPSESLKKQLQLRNDSMYPSSLENCFF